MIMMASREKFGMTPVSKIPRTSSSRGLFIRRRERRQDDSAVVWYLPGVAKDRFVGNNPPREDSDSKLSF